MKKKVITLFILLNNLFFLAPAFAEVFWTDWTAATKGESGSALGTITDNNLNTISVTYSGDINFAQTSGGGTNYWTPSDTYTTPAVSNAPPDSDIITLEGGSQNLNTITFSESVTNPIIAIAAMGQTNASFTFEFTSSFFVLNSGEGFFGNGTLELVPFNILKGNEGNGLIQFIGTYSSISWTAPTPIPFDWSGFTVGIPSESDTAYNNPNKPVLSSPSNGSSNVSLTPTLRTQAFSDPDASDTHSRTEWHISTSSDFDSSVFYENSLLHLTKLDVPNLILEENRTYYWRVRFYDNDGYPSEWSNKFYFRTLSTQNDLNNNGIPDDLENTTVDLDGDGTSDIQQTNIKSLDTEIGDGQMGLSIKDSTTVTEIKEISSIDPVTISDLTVPTTMPLGLFGFRICVETPGDTANVIVYFSEAADINAKWYLYDSVNGWTDYSAHATFSQDRKSVNLEFKDGGYGDADGFANGIIVDPSGFGIASWVKGFVSDASTKEKVTTATVTFDDLKLDLKTVLDGNYISMILPGSYDFTISAPGYKPQTVSSLEIPEATIVTKDISLEGKIQINDTSISATQFQVNQPIQFSIDAQTDTGNSLYYRFSTHPDYGTDNYDGTQWTSMTSEEYTTENSISYTFTKAGKHIVVIWVTPDPVNPQTEGITIIGFAVDVNDDTCKTIVTGADISGDTETDTAVTFSVDAQNDCSEALYYRWSVHPDYGTDGYDGLHWENMTDTEWVTTSSIDYTFTESGKYIIVVWVTDDVDNVNPVGIPIVGWSVDIE